MSYAKIVIDHAALRRLDKAAQRALGLTAEAVHERIVKAQVMPFDTGHLQNDTTFVDASGAPCGHVEIVTGAPYARRLYYHPEFHFRTRENPNARGKWFDDWLEGGVEEGYATEAFAELYRREAGL